MLRSKSGAALMEYVIILSIGVAAAVLVATGSEKATECAVETSTGPLQGTSTICQDNVARNGGPELFRNPYIMRINDGQDISLSAEQLIMVFGAKDPDGDLVTVQNVSQSTDIAIADVTWSGSSADFTFGNDGLASSVVTFIDNQGNVTPGTIEIQHAPFACPVEFFKPADDIYATGDIIPFSVRFDRPALFAEDMRLILSLDNGEREVEYVSGQGSDIVAFQYVVKDGDLDPSGIELTGRIEGNAGEVPECMENITSGLLPSMPNVKVDTRIISLVTPFSPVDNGQFGSGIDYENNILVAGYPERNNGEVELFTDGPESWTRIQRILAPAGAVGFGTDISLWNDLLVIGAPGSDGSLGRVYIYEKGTTGSYDLAREFRSTDVAAGLITTGDEFGFRVSAGGGYVLAAAPSTNKTDTPGRVFLMSKESGEWTIAEVPHPTDASNPQAFGYGMDIAKNGGQFVIGDPRANSDTGEVYVFNKKAVGEFDYVDSFTSATAGQFGFDVSIDGSHMIIGAPFGNAFKGAAVIYEKSGSSWTEEGILSPSSLPPLSQFGYSVDIDGDRAAVGQPSDLFPGNPGSSWILTRFGNSWLPVVNPMVAPVHGALFGYDVAVYGNRIAVSGRDDSTAGAKTGVVRTY